MTVLLCPVRLRDRYVSSGALKKPPSFHLVSSQFALHYAFEVGPLPLPFLSSP